MPDAVDFLERLGQDARLRYATSSELELALAEADIDPALRAVIQGAALHDANRARLETLLGATANICCLIRHNDDEDQDDDSDEDTDDDLNDDDDDGNPDKPRALDGRGTTAR
jgi:hypothetical protein